MKINWGSLPDIPPASGQTEQKGLAGALAGVSSEMLIVAGGSNFPDSLPWQGGTKTYYNDIFFFNLNGKETTWHVASEKLPVPLAYSACVSVNDELICIGGENLNGTIPGVLKLKFDKGEMQISTLTDFPVAVSNCGAAAIGPVVYVAGGLGAEGYLSSFYSADVSKDMPEWAKLPDLPQPVSNAVVVSQWDGNEECIYVLGGRNRNGELSTFFSSVLKYSPSKKSWELAGEISNAQKELVTLAAGTGVAVGKNLILLFGGDNGQLYNKTEEYINAATAAETPEEKETINKQKIKHLKGHPGFSRQVFWYNTLTGECKEEGELSFPAQVTTLAVKFNNRIYIPNGEIRPGVRTPKVNVADLSGDNLE
ncbi:hypothetical protein INQ51_02045 [Maribellus sp. CM-23]|uniref:Kelch repeat-containing protein n=1 Tax=Maribellus sp. CM-23 TaxID=2781026 RepID=UPI001F1AF44E|nr:hypothetical protein [Maribellus sp. CM-23]MCE4563082.1 hypothetical protein [Maribellus sp. CM-23]